MGKEKFPKIAAETTIKSCTKVKGGVSVKFNELNFTGSQYEKIADWIDDDTEVVMTLEQKQGNLFDTENQSDSESQDTPDKELPSDTTKNIEIKIPKAWGVKCFIKIGTIEGTWRYGHYIKIGNIEDVKEFGAGAVAHTDAATCCQYLRSNLVSFIEEQENFKYTKQLIKKIEKAIDAWLFENN